MISSEGGAAPEGPLRISRRNWVLALSILPVLALINIGVLVFSLDGLSLADRIVKPHFLYLALGLVFVPLAVNSLRLLLWSRFLGADLRPVQAVRIVTGTMVANAVTPSATGGAPIRWLMIISEGIDGQRALTLLSFQIIEDMLILMSLLAAAAGLTGYIAFEALAGNPELLQRIGLSAQSLLSGGLIGIATAAAVLVAAAHGWFGASIRRWMGKIGHRIRHVASSTARDWRAMLSHGKWLVLANLALAILQWIARFSIAALVLTAFGAKWQPVLYWLLQYLVQVISSVVPTPGGAGGAEAAFLLLFAPFLPDDILWTAMTTWRLMFFYLPLAVAAVMFFLLNRLRVDRDENLTAVQSLNGTRRSSGK